MKILIADDNKQITSILDEYARKEKYETVIVHDGQAAVQAFEAHHPDLLLLDVMMPVIDGFSVCREIMKKLLIIGLTVLAVGAAGTAVVAASGNETPADIIASLTGRSQEEVQAEKQERDLTYGAMAAEAGELEAFRSESRRHVRQQGTGER